MVQTVNVGRYWQWVLPGGVPVKITNKHGLPEPILAAVRWYSKPRSGLSVTGLLKSPRAHWLERRHYDQIEVDASDLAWAMSGSSWHESLAKHTGDQLLQEERISIEIDGVKVSGQPDVYDADTQTIWDYKECSTWKIKYGDFLDWRFQLSAYALLFTVCGFPVRNLKICAKQRDFVKKMKRGRPKKGEKNSPIVVIDLPLDIDIKEKMKKRVMDIMQHENTPDDDLPECEDAYLWKKDTYAVMKTGRKTALRVLDTEAEALNWQSVNGGDFVQHRPGEPKRCEYCNAREFCNQYQKMVDSIPEE